MRLQRSKICCLVLVVVILPGIAEFLENAAHLVIEGHAAHTRADGDRHPPEGPEHGCTPAFHFCGCHASLVLLGAEILPPILLRAVGSPARPAPDARSGGFSSTVDRPPRA